MERRRSRTARADGPSAQEFSGACVACGEALFAKRCASCGVAVKAGEFVVERVLHTSERGRVYLAKARDGRKVALKELVFAVVPDAATVDAFLREGRMLETLVHPGIPRSIASFREGDGPATRLYLAQEYVAGDSLDKELETRRYDEQDVRVIAREVLGILVYLHGRSPMVVHRDVKPANLVRREDGSLALVDFDAARDVRPGGTHRATLVGTFGYMPLEQLGGSVDDTADLYALGATLLHLLARRSPHELLTTEYEFELDPSVNASPAFKAWLGKLVARHARDRFQSAREALDALAPPESRQPEPVSTSARTPVQTPPSDPRVSGEVAASIFAGVGLLLMAVLPEPAGLFALAGCAAGGAMIWYGFTRPSSK